MKHFAPRSICTFKPADLDLLARVLSKAAALQDVDVDDDREARALEAIRLFQSGITDELTLIKMLSYSSTKEADVSS